MTEFQRPGCRLKCSPLAYLKWQFLAHAGPSEAAGLGLSAEHDPLYLQDILVINQKATVSTVAFEDEAIADLFDKMTDQQIPPQPLRENMASLAPWCLSETQQCR